MSARRQPASFAPFMMEGEYDLATASSLGADLLAYAATTEGDVVVNCAGLTFMDSSTISELVTIHRTLADEGRVLRLEDVHGAPLKMLTITGLLGHFAVNET